MPNLIALYSHGRRAGKNTAAEFIRDECLRRNLVCELKAFADLPKLLVAEILRLEAASDQGRIQMVDDFKLHGNFSWRIGPPSFWEGLSGGGTGRDLIINLAGELGKDEDSGARKLFGETFWTDMVLPLDWEPDADMTVITDLRSVEEAYRIHRLNGLVVQITGPRAQTPGGRSEQGLDAHHIDRTLDNSSDLPTLSTRCGELVDQLIRGVHV